MKRTSSKVTRNSRNASAQRRTASRHRASTAMCAAPPAPPPGPCTPPCATTPEELRAWIQATRSALEQKQARERAYLKRRAFRGRQTPTDDVYEQDHQLEDDLLALLNEMEARV